MSNVSKWRNWNWSFCISRNECVEEMIADDWLVTGGVASRLEVVWGYQRSCWRQRQQCAQWGRRWRWLDRTGKVANATQIASFRHEFPCASVVGRRAAGPPPQIHGPSTGRSRRRWHLSAGPRAHRQGPHRSRSISSSYTSIFYLLFFFLFLCPVSVCIVAIAQSVDSVVDLPVFNTFLKVFSSVQ